MKETLDIVLLLALPASGKSEVRRYLHFQTPEVCKNEFHMGSTVQLDDFPYVHMMRRLDDELAALGKERLFFHAPDKPFKDPIDWGTLTVMLNEDYEDLLARKIVAPESAAAHLYERIDQACQKVGGPARFSKLDAEIRQNALKNLETEAKKMLDEKQSAYTDLGGKTVVIEFARGGAHGSSMPLCKPFGYQYTLSVLSEAILEKAAILYIWVTPEESRRKNSARANPDDPGSILHHGVPMDVMMGDYGCDDMDHLEKNSDVPSTIAIEAHGKKFHLPIGRFDNRVDKTTFLREDPNVWAPEKIEQVRNGLKQALEKVASLKQ